MKLLITWTICRDAVVSKDSKLSDIGQISLETLLSLPESDISKSDISEWRVDAPLEFLDATASLQIVHVINSLSNSFIAKKLNVMFFLQISVCCSQLNAVSFNFCDTNRK